MSIVDDLKWRYATKEFDSSKKLSKQQLDDVLESLRLSTSSFGLQTWKFLVVEDSSVRQKLLEHSWNQKQVVEASHVLVLCIPTDFGNEHIEKFVKSMAQTRDVSLESLDGYKKMMEGFVSRKDEKALKVWMTNQVYISLGHLLTACASLKIDACPMEGFISKEYDRILGLGEKNLKSVLVCPIGFRSSDDKYANAVKVRFPKEDLFIHI